MRAIHGFVLALCLVLTPALPASAQEANDPVATAIAVLDRLDAGEYEAATRDFNAQMKAALGVEQLKGVQQQIEAAGAVASRSEPRVSQQDGFTVVVVRIQRQLAAIDATVAIDGDGKVAGLHFLPASAGAQ